MAHHPARLGVGRVLRLTLFGFAGLVILVIAAGAVFVATFDVNGYKPRIIAAVEQATGRTLALNGPIGLKLSLQPTIEARDVAFANPPGFSRPQMVTLERLDLQVALLPLLSKRVEVDRLVLVRPDIRLETDTQGHPNWQMQPEATIAPAPAGQQPALAATGQQAQIAVRDVRIQDGTVEYRNGKTGQSTTLAIRQLSASGGTGEPLHVTADASYDGAPLALTATFGSLQGGLPVALDVTVKVANASLTAKGGIADLPGMSGVHIDIAVQIPDLQALSPLAHSDLPALKAVAFQVSLADLKGGLANGAALQGLKLTSPVGDLSGQVTAALGAPPMVTADLKSDRVDMEALMASLGRPVAPAEGQAAPTIPPAPPKSGRLFSEQPIPFAALKQVQADVRLAIGVLHNSATDYKAINVHAVLKGGNLRLDPMAADLPGGRLDAKLAVDGSQATPPVSLSAHAPGLALAPLLAAFRMPGYATGNLEIYADLHGAGQSMHAIAASLDGTLGLAVPGGTIDSRLIGGTLGSVLDKVNGFDPLSRGGSGELRCFAARLDLRNGVGTFKALQLSSSLLTMDGAGSINLGAETLDMRLRAKGKVAVTDIVVPVRVTGALRSPQTAVDTVGAATSNAGSIAGAVVTHATPLGILGGMVGADKLLGLAAGDPCPAALAIARGQAAPAAAAPTAAPAPAPAPATQQPKLPQPGNTLRNLFR